MHCCIVGATLMTGDRTRIERLWTGAFGVVNAASLIYTLVMVSSQFKDHRPNLVLSQIISVAVLGEDIYGSWTYTIYVWFQSILLLFCAAFFSHFGWRVMWILREFPDADQLPR